MFEKIKQVFESLTGGTLLWLNAFISYRTETVMHTTTQFSSESRGQYKAKAYAAASAKSSLPPPRSHGAIRVNTMFRSKSYSAVSVTLTSTPSVASGARCLLFIHVFPDMRSLAVSPRSALQSPSSSLATLPQQAAWLTLMATARSARPVLSSIVRI